jgi:hypothetical protein
MGHPENFFEEDSDDDRWTIAEWSVLIGMINEHGKALQRLENEDYLGFHMFADRPGWVEARLGRDAPQQ